MKTKGSRLYSVIISLIVALGGFLLGFDSAVISGATPFYKSFFNLTSGSLLIGLSVSSIILGATTGNIIAGPLADKFGRKPILIVTAFLFAFCALGCAIAQNIFFFISARVIGGFGVGMAILVAPMFIAETAPKKLRGLLVTFNQLNIVLGISIAYFSNYFILKNVEDPTLNWRLMLGVGSIPALLYFILLFIVPESPRWLMRKNRENEASKIFCRIGGEEHAENEMNEIRQSLANPINKEKENLANLFSKRMKLVLIIGLGIAFFQQITGINAIFYYAPMIFEMAGGGKDSAFIQASILGVTNVVMTIVAMTLIDRLGRKPLLIIGSIGITIALSIAGFTFKNAKYVISEESLNKIKIELLTGNVNENQSNALIVSLSAMKDISYSSEVEFFQTIEKNIGKANYNQYKETILKNSITINSLLVLIGLILYVASFAISLGPVMWAMLSEIFPNKIRGLAISVVGLWNSIVSFSVATVFPAELEKLGSGSTYIIFAIFGLLTLLFVLKFVPETKGKSLEELEKILVK
jgi:sugar porter (SP) family MFS transporter